MRHLRVIGLYALLPVLLLGGWWVLTEFRLVRPLFLPHPMEVARTAGNLWADGQLPKHGVASILRIVSGFLLTFCIAFPIGAAMGLSQTGRRILEPLNSLFRYMPFPAFVPLLILWFGIGLKMQIGVIVVGTVFQLTVLFRDAFCGIHKEYVETAKSLSFSPLPMFLLAAAMGLIVSMFAVVAVDLTRVATMGMTLMMYLTPVIYSKTFNSPVVQMVNKWNPLTYLVCSCRDVIIYGRLYDVQGYFFCAGLSLLAFLIAWRLFYVSEHMIIERMI